jgi:hypothetical protein
MPTPWKKLRQFPIRRGRIPAFCSRHWEAMMSRVINFDKGSKRRIQEVRWSLTEIVSAVLLSLVLIVLGVLLGAWEVSHYHAPPKAPQISQP